MLCRTWSVGVHVCKQESGCRHSTTHAIKIFKLREGYNQQCIISSSFSLKKTPMQTRHSQSHTLTHVRPTTNGRGRYTHYHTCNNMTQQCVVYIFLYISRGLVYTSTAEHSCSTRNRGASTFPSSLWCGMSEWFVIHHNTQSHRHLHTSTYVFPRRTTDQTT